MTSDSQRAPGLVYTGGNQYRRMNDTELAQRRNLYGFAEGGLATGGMPEWNKAFNPDVPEYGDLGRDFGREVLYYSPEAAAPVQAPAAAAPVLPPDASAGVYEGGAGGQDFGGGYTSTPDWDTTNTLGNMLSNYGLPSIGDYLQQAAKEGQADARMAVNEQTGAYSQNAQNQRAAEAVAAQAAADNAAWGGTMQGMQGNVGSMEGSGSQAGVSAGGYGGFGGDTGGSDTGGFGGDYAHGGITGYAQGGLGSLGGYSDGGRLLRGPGDGVSDSIPATIGRGKQPARLADGEFVVPARIVSELGNGSTEAGARKLYAMMDRIQKNRGKTVGKGRVAANSRSERHLPA